MNKISYLASAPGSFRADFPQVDYGQPGGAWSPDSRGPVYQAMEWARQDAAFALLFCADILFGKRESGDATWLWIEVPLESGAGWTRERQTTLSSDGEGWLYNRNTLNPVRSWVPQLFGPPSIAVNGTWRLAVPCSAVQGGGRPAGSTRYSFIPDAVLGDAETVRLLSEGHFAFSAQDGFGTVARVPYAADALPYKGYRGRPEAGNAKR